MVVLRKIKRSGQRLKQVHEVGIRWAWAAQTPSFDIKYGARKYCSRDCNWTPGCKFQTPAVELPVLTLHSAVGKFLDSGSWIYFGLEMLPLHANRYFFPSICVSVSDGSDDGKLLQ